MTDVLDPPAAAPAREPEVAARPDPPRRRVPIVSRVLDRVERATTNEWMAFLATVLVVGGCTAFTLAQLHPDLLVARTTPTGGDMGAHVWGPAYLRDHLLPHWRLSGWSPDWYAGFPMYQFYMVLPALLVVLVNVVLPYGIALKLVSVLGIVTLPIGAFTFGKLWGLRFPIPQLMSLATTLFLFDETFTIYGGNIASTMAGEFSFSISLSFAMFYLAVLGYGLRTGRLRWLAAVLLACCALSHLIVFFFACAGTAVAFLLFADRHRFRYLATFLPVAGLLTVFWMVPFWARRFYMTDMGYERRTDYWKMIFPQGLVADRVIFAAAALGLVMSLLRGRKAGVFWGVLAIGYGAWAVVWPQGHLWNARLLPFMYLSRYQLVALGIAELGFGLAWLVRRISPRVDARAIGGATALTFGALGTFVVLGMSLRVLPFGTTGSATVDGKAVSQYHWMGMSSNKAAFVDDWAKWNYSGYEAKPAYGEYRSIMLTMGEVGAKHGCGRAEWEYTSDQGRYGTPMAMMLLPFWTDGCIGSMEGLFFESSATTPYHFMASSALSEKPSRPVRGLPYDPLDVSKGVKYLQLLGVKYYMAFSAKAVEEADANPDLALVATSGPWKVYEVAKSDLVEPLRNEPAVVTDDVRSSMAWRDMAVSTFTKPDTWNVLLAGAGPARWQRVASTTAPEAKPLPPVIVTNTVERDDSISFTVDKVGVPVLVKVSYFPNWKVSGGSGPYRVAPNLMVVIPTSNDVRLSYGRTPIDLVTLLGSLLGLVALVALARSRPIAMPEHTLPPLLDRRSAEPAAGGAWPRAVDDLEWLAFEWEDAADDPPPVPDP